MRRIEVDPAAMVAVVEPGLFNAEVKDAARQHGLWYPPDPSSFEICSIGGNLATNAGGLCCVKYGVTTDYVLGMQVVLADGRAVRLGGRTIKDVAGYDLKRLFVGTEGTLGVMTEATLRLRPMPPPATTLVATFPDIVAAGRAVIDIVGRFRPAALELMDRTSIGAVEDCTRMGLDRELGGTAARPLRCGRRAVGGRGGGHATGPASGRARTTWRPPTTRTRVSSSWRPAAWRSRRWNDSGTVLIEDVGVPIPRIPELVAGVEGGGGPPRHHHHGDRPCR